MSNKTCRTRVHKYILYHKGHVYVTRETEKNPLLTSSSQRPLKEASSSPFSFVVNCQRRHKTVFCDATYTLSAHAHQNFTAELLVRGRRSEGTSPVWKDRGCMRQLKYRWLSLLCSPPPQF